MALIADILLAAGALAAGLYCAVLSHRLRRFARLEDGMGGAIAVLSAQVDDMTRALRAAQKAAQGSEAALAAQTERAERATERLSLMLASLHDLPVAVGGATADAPAAPPDAGTVATAGADRPTGSGPQPASRLAGQAPGDAPSPGVSSETPAAADAGGAAIQDSADHEPAAAVPASPEAGDSAAGAEPGPGSDDESSAASAPPRRLRFVRRRVTSEAAE